MNTTTLYPTPAISIRDPFGLRNNLTFVNAQTINSTTIWVASQTEIGYFAIVTVTDIQSAVLYHSVGANPGKATWTQDASCGLSERAFTLCSKTDTIIRGSSTSSSQSQKTSWELEVASVTPLVFENSTLRAVPTPTSSITYSLPTYQPTNTAKSESVETLRHSSYRAAVVYIFMCMLLGTLFII